MEAIKVSFGLVLFLIVASLLFTMRGKVWKGLAWVGVQGAVGLFILFGVNLVAGYFGLYVPYNLVTVAVAAILGLPGALALVGIQLFLT